MTHFGLVLQPGQSIFDQLVSAAQKAILSGELTEGQAFPSVRALAADLKIHPNTAHKAVQYLIAALIAEARRMGLSADELKRAIDAGWGKTAATVEVGR